jgi:hypothetical protein
MSAHHYFRDFAYCDSGMIPWLLVLERICASGQSLADLVGERMNLFPCSGEINRRIPDVPGAIAAVQAHYAAQATSVDHTDGLSMEFEGAAGAGTGAWRLNLRGSNTEPLIRLNVEARGSEALMQQKTAEVLALLAKASTGRAQFGQDRPVPRKGRSKLRIELRLQFGFMAWHRSDPLLRHIGLRAAAGADPPGWRPRQRLDVLHAPPPGASARSAMLCPRSPQAERVSSSLLPCDHPRGSRARPVSRTTSRLSSIRLSMSTSCLTSAAENPPSSAPWRAIANS